MKARASTPPPIRCELGRVGLKRVVRGPKETKILKRHDRQATPEIADRLAQRRPLRAGGLQQAYFVFLDEDEIAVLICSDTAFGCRFAQVIERPKSLPVTVQNSGPFFRAGEAGAFEVGRGSGERVLHGSAMGSRSLRGHRNAKNIYAQAVHSQVPKRVTVSVRKGKGTGGYNRPGLAPGKAQILTLDSPRLLP